MEIVRRADRGQVYSTGADRGSGQIVGQEADRGSKQIGGQVYTFDRIDGQDNIYKSREARWHGHFE